MRYARRRYSRRGRSSMVRRRVGRITLRRRIGWRR